MRIIDGSRLCFLVGCCIFITLAGGSTRSQNLRSWKLMDDPHGTTKPSNWDDNKAQLRPLKQEKAAFLHKFGRQYGYNGWIDHNWHREVGSRFGPNLRHYLDFTASSLYTKTHLEAATQMLSQHTLSNPHSRNPSSLAAERQLELARSKVLKFFNAPESEYVVIFTKGATDALKTVGEHFPWSSPSSWHPPRKTPPGGFSDTHSLPVTECGAIPAAVGNAINPGVSHFVYLRSNHKSVLGIGGYAKARGAALHCVDEAGIIAWLDSSSSSSSNKAAVSSTVEPTGTDTVLVDRAGKVSSAATLAAEAAAKSPQLEEAGQEVTYSLVAYPSKDNYEGRLYPLEWIAKIQAKSTPGHRWLVVVDAAAYAPTHPLDLSKVHPDFVPISFYKIFGFPTGLGALIARKESVALLHKEYFGGGSVVDATAEDVWRVLMPAPEGFEDGTLNFLGIAQLQFGLQQLEQLGGMQAVEAHVSSLQAWTYRALSRIKHSNGQPLVKLFGRHEDPKHQSCIFQLLVLRPDGSAVSSNQLEVVAASQGIAVRTGCMCNPSQCIYDLGLKPEEHRAAILNKTDMSSGFLTVLRPAGDGSGRMVPVQIPTGSVRVSLGYLSTFEDVYALVAFLLRDFKDNGGLEVATSTATATW